MGKQAGAPTDPGQQYPSVSAIEFDALLKRLGMDEVNVCTFANLSDMSRPALRIRKSGKPNYRDAALLKILSMWPQRPVVVDFNIWQGSFAKWLHESGVYPMAGKPDDMDEESYSRRQGPASAATHRIARQPKAQVADGVWSRPLVIENMKEPGICRGKYRRVLLLPVAEQFNGSAESLERLEAFKKRAEWPAAGLFGRDVFHFTDEKATDGLNAAPAVAPALEPAVESKHAELDFAAAAPEVNPQVTDAVAAKPAAPCPAAPASLPLIHVPALGMELPLGAGVVDGKACVTVDKAYWMKFAAAQGELARNARILELWDKLHSAGIKAV